jgi:hypothetical protein
MSDDSFIREVDEELRQDRAKALWQKYGIWIVSAAVLIILGTLAVTQYRAWVESRANASGDAFLRALTLANEGKSDEALAALSALEADGYGAYPVLARLRAATVHAAKGDHAAAIAAFDAVAAEGSVPDAVRAMARLRAAYLLVDHGDRAAVAERAETLTAEGNPLRHSALEVIALSAWKAGALAEARDLFERIAGDETAPRSVRDRATMMAELLRGAGATG